MHLLLEDGMDVNYRCSNTQRTPLLLAVEERDVLMTRFLLRHGASVSMTDVEGRTPLLRAAEQGSGTMVKAILLSSRTALNLQDSKGDTPLTVAAAKCEEDVIEILLEYGADPDIANNMGDTPLDLLLASKTDSASRKRIMKMLEGAKRDKQASNPSLFTDKPTLPFLGTLALICIILLARSVRQYYRLPVSDSIPIWFLP